MKPELVFSACFWVAFLAFPIQARGQDLVHHVIVLLDRSGSVDDDTPMAEIERLIRYDLSQLCFSDGAVVPNRQLLDRGRGDVLSILSFGKGSRERDLRRFIQDVPSRELETQRFGSDYDERIFWGLARHIREPFTRPGEGRYDFFNRYWSLISLAMPLALEKLGHTDSKVTVNRTFVILATDGEFNSGDPNMELAVNNLGIDDREKARALGICQDIQSAFIWRPVAENRQRGNFKLRTFEFIPIAKVFAIESLLRFNGETVLFQRHPDGYRASILLTPTNALSEMHVDGVEANLVDPAGVAIPGNSFSLKGVKSPKTLNFAVGNDQYNAALQLRLTFTALWQEPRYGVHQLHPNGDPLQGANGLQRVIPARFEAPVSIWGVLPLGDALYRFTAGFWSPNQHAVANFWEGVTVAFVALTFILLFAKLVLHLRKRAVVSEEQFNDQEIRID